MPAPCVAQAVATEAPVSASTPNKALSNIAHASLPGIKGGRLVNNCTSFIEEHRIRSYEVGADQRTTIVTIANLLQEVAGNHAVALWGRTEEGFATDPVMVELNLIFAATRIQVQMDSYPKWGDTVQIETWFQAEGRVGARRDWLVKDATSGNVIGRATSTWVMVNHKTKRLAKIPNKMRKKLEVFAPTPERNAVPVEEARQRLPTLKMPAEIVGPVQVARRSDVDMNGHINNVTYLAWTLETVPLEIFRTCELKQFEIDYKAECHSGDMIESLGGYLEEESSKTCTKRFVHMLQRSNDSGCTELVKARTTWECK